jgi:hypothetical protein
VARPSAFLPTYRRVLFRLRLRPELFFALLRPLLLREEPAAAALRRRVAAPLRAAAEREALDRARDAAPPFLPPFRAAVLVLFLPRPDPLCFPPPSSLFTVAQARRSASRRETPRFSYPSSICSAFRFCLLVYDDLSPRGMVVISHLELSRVPSRHHRHTNSAAAGWAQTSQVRSEGYHCCGMGHSQLPVASRQSLVASTTSQLTDAPFLDDTAAASREYSTSDWRLATGNWRLGDWRLAIS